MSTLSFLGKLRFPYSDYEHGFWGKQTSTLNFCEEVSLFNPWQAKAGLVFL